MSEKVDLYNTSYRNAARDVYSEIRRETYGADLGLTSWMSAEELEEIPHLLQLQATSHALEIGCGAGGCALHFAAQIGCRVTGIDLNPSGVSAAEHTARSRQLQDHVTFFEHNAADRFASRITPLTRPTPTTPSAISRIGSGCCGSAAGS